MMRSSTNFSAFGGTLTIFSFIAVIFFPWPFTMLLVLASSFFVPLVPLAIGIFADALYYAPHASSAPLFTLYGAVITAVAILVRRRLWASII